MDVIELMSINIDLIDFIDSLLEVAELALIGVLILLTFHFHKRIKALEDYHDYVLHLKQQYRATREGIPHRLADSPEYQKDEGPPDFDG